MLRQPGGGGLDTSPIKTRPSQTSGPQAEATGGDVRHDRARASDGRLATIVAGLVRWGICEWKTPTGTARIPSTPTPMAPHHGTPTPAHCVTPTLPTTTIHTYTHKTHAHPHAQPRRPHGVFPQPADHAVVLQAQGHQPERAAGVWVCVGGWGCSTFLTQMSHFLY